MVAATPHVAPCNVDLVCFTEVANDMAHIGFEKIQKPTYGENYFKN